MINPVIWWNNARSTIILQSSYIVSAMITQKEEFNASINLLVTTKMGNLHDIQHNGLCQPLNPWLGDEARLLPS
jgi:hypothetical protein